MGKTFSQQLLCLLEQIKTEYVLLLLDDFFLLEPVNEEGFSAIWEFAKINKDVGYLGIPKSLSENDHGKANFYNVDLSVERLTIGNPVLWRTDYFLKIIKGHESSWDFERYSVLRARQFPDRVMRYNSNNSIVVKFKHPGSFDDGRYLVGDGYGIVRGKWLKSNKELFERYGLEVNFDNLGWYVEGENPAAPFWKRVLEKHINDNGLLGKVCRRIAKIIRQSRQRHKKQMLELSSKL